MPINGIIFSITLNYFLDCVKSLKIGFEETEIPVDDDNTTFHRLCEKLEYLLHAGMRGLLYLCYQYQFLWLFEWI